LLICGIDYLSFLDKLLLLKAKDFEDQCKRINSLINLVDINLIIIDSLGFLYRKEIRNSPSEINKKMDRQLRVLTEVSRRGVPILITNQVSTNLETGEIKMVGGDMVKNWSKKLIELKRDPRTIVLKKPEEKQKNFEIVEEGIRIL